IIFHMDNLTICLLRIRGFSVLFRSILFVFRFSIKVYFSNGTEEFVFILLRKLSSIKQRLYILKQLFSLLFATRAILFFSFLDKFLMWIANVGLAKKIIYRNAKKFSNLFYCVCIRLSFPYLI